VFAMDRLPTSPKDCINFIDNIKSMEWDDHYHDQLTSTSLLNIFFKLITEKGKELTFDVPKNEYSFRFKSLVAKMVDYLSYSSFLEIGERDEYDQVKLGDYVDFDLGNKICIEFLKKHLGRKVVFVEISDENINGEGVLEHCKEMYKIEFIVGYNH